MNTKTTIMGMAAPKKECDDKNCPFHGELKVRGKTFTGTVVSDKMQKSIKVQWSGARLIPKYERYEKTRTKISAHNPSCINAKKGDVVLIGECRPLSKTKNFVVLGIVGAESVKEIMKEDMVSAPMIKKKVEANKKAHDEKPKSGKPVKSDKSDE